MEKLIYKEEQSFRQTFVLWIILASFIMIIVSISRGFYHQLYLGKPFGDNPMSDQGLIGSGIFSIVLISALVIFMLSAKLTTEIWTDGIRYKFPPLVRRIRHISVSDIVSVNVEKYRPIVEFGGWGWRKKLLRRKTAYNVSGRLGIRVMKKDGSMVLFGTQQEEEMKRAVKRMMSPPDPYKY